MRFSRQLLASVLTALIAVPAPVFAQTVRIAVEAPVSGAPAFSASVPFALSAPALSAPALSPFSASFPVLPAPSIPLAPAAAVPAALKPRTSGAALVAGTLSAPSAPERPAEAQKADADARFDGSIQGEGAASPVAAPPVAAEAPRLVSADVDRRISALGSVPAPRPWLNKAKIVLAYGGLTAAAVALHAPFEHLGPMIVGAVMAPMTGFMGLFYYSLMQQSAVAGGPLEGEEEERPSAETMGMIARLAAEAKVPAPARVKVLSGEKVQAQVGNRDDAGYEIRFTKAFEALRPEVREGILRHEFAHERHHDLPYWQVANIMLTPFAPMIGMMALQGKTDIEGALVGVLAAASILLFPASLKSSEYLADQYAASKPQGAGPLVRFFIEDSDNPVRAASALSGAPFASESGWKRRAISSWDHLRTLFRAHPSHDRRIARLVRLAEKAAAKSR